MAAPSLSFVRLVRPYSALFALAFAAMLLEGAADLAEAWSLKVIFDYVLAGTTAPAWPVTLGIGRQW